VTGTASEVLARAAELAAISEEDGRLTRRFATPALARAGELVAGWMQAAGLTVRRDPVGNVIGRVGEGPPLVIGSHLDTVPNAGRYDGPLGVLVAIAVVERLRAGGAPPSAPLEVAAFADEEGTRFGTAYLGSAGYAGAFEPAWLDLADADGVTMVEAIRRQGGDPDAVVSMSAPELAGYLEVHIEQGPVLEREDVPVGVVRAIAGQTRASITLRGQAGHAGTLPMAGRRDALVAAAEAVVAVERIGQSEEGLVATVGVLSVSFGAPNVVAAEAQLSLDVRHARDERRDGAVAAIRAEVERIASERGLEWVWTPLHETNAVEMTPELRERLADGIRAHRLPVRELVSGAGHDAVVLSRICPAAMLFVRCEGGISHDPRESVAEEDVAVALDVLEHAVRSFA
jgi:allantoate deiminase